jgi:hypothetical protein
LIFGLGFWSSYSRREKSASIPYLLVTCVFILGFSILIPLNMTFRQMDGMDVYYIPVLLMAVPVLVSGADQAASFMKKRFAVLLALPVLFLIGFRLPGITISGENGFETFRKYLIETTPEHAVIISAVDEIAYAYYYSVFAQNNPKDFHLVDPKTVEADKSLFKQYGLRAASFFDLHSPFLAHVDDFEDVRIAGPFFVFKKDSVMAHQFEREFQRRFSFQEKDIASMRLLDRQNFALIWAKRGIFWIDAADAGPADSQSGKKAFQTGCAYLKRACDLDDFSFMGASHAANLALISIQAGHREHVEDLARRALRINPFAVNAHKALALLYALEKDQ